MKDSVLVPAAVATALLVALAVAAAVVTSRPERAGPDPVPLVAGETSPGGRAAALPAGAAATGRAGPDRAAAVLRAWDARRAAAWAAADADALAGLYAAGSAAGRADLRMLAVWRERGLRVTGLHPELLGVEVVHRGPARLVLRVRERWGRALAVGPGVRRPLPATGAATRRVELRRAGGTWQVVEARRAT